MADADRFIPLAYHPELTDTERIAQASAFYHEIKERRTVREFSDEEIPLSVIEDAIKAAGTAPNGANKQPWHFAIVKSPEIKKKIREAAEEEEKAFYGGRANQEWLDDLKIFGTNPEKPFLEKAPYLIVIFAKPYDVDENGNRKQNYYVKESVGIATGFLIAALHKAGLATLTHTPSPMGFLTEILERPKHEKPFILLVTGKAAQDAKVPDITKKGFDDIASIH